MSYSLNKLETMQLQKRWPDLPGGLTIHDKKEALHVMIAAEERKTRSSFMLAIAFTAIAIFWTVYI
ncbi:hypothetical protein [Escherichia sp. E1130]|uniref:hypothetical protein n=1 Tax=Escherichia sp. E1130 TaxID=2041645 RepID=UPI0010805BBB|nr:hypothetical protein [Escherichia sp. E1130]TGC20682.1 hypothetical protein CQJ27_25995 [Escherichia sp. E1130]TLI62828.1 hypothetical protein FEK66_24500 [Escherichia sp. E1130]